MMIYSVCIHPATENYTKRKVRAFTGKCVVHVYADAFFGGEIKTYISRVLENPTWGTLYQCAKTSQKHTRDMHHCFFEGAYVHHTHDEPSDITVLNLALGS